MTDVDTKAVFVLDASALLCLLFGEPGADRVEMRLTGALVSVVNYHEVLAKLTDCGVDAAEAQMMLAELDIDIVPADRDQADVGGKLRPETRDIGLSLGDRSCLALALCRNATAVSADRAWEALDVGVVVELVR
ncbi:type II toxin-antitoxin system VapC family toxin [Sphingobium sp. YR768]|uniref:type II toxin-antitoxin system VapC family toxin n=1 Tax=Sphingobium sp. YR768 TaxID=1884365 RepID=UPI0008B8D98E|nr:type II toxin-antitoxin system VapC family toxin [Sphingobium sp. YR768]SES12262.1 PIN domain nuclease, a component of toxin-antitoxin system (PIN domain) [Sphingobium sp. YR768]